MATHEDDDTLENEKTTAEECPNCGAPVAWEDVCAECGHALDEDVDANDEVGLDEELDTTREDDYDLDDLERDTYEIDEMDEVEADPFADDTSTDDDDAF